MVDHEANKTHMLFADPVGKGTTLRVSQHGKGLLGVREGTVCPWVVDWDDVSSGGPSSSTSWIKAGKKERKRKICGPCEDHEQT